MKNSILNIALCLLGGFTAASAAAEAPMRRPLSTEQPMYIYHIDTWNNADPQKVIDLVPDDMRPYTVFNISLSVSANVTKDGYRTAESWLRTCAENRVWAMIQPASGGHSWLSDYEFDVYHYFFQNYPNFLGLNYCEQFWGFDDSDGLHPFGDKSPTIADRMNLFANLLDICHEYGGYLVISNCLVRPEWDGTSPLTMYRVYPEFAKQAKKHKEHLIYCEKYTMSANYYDMESMCLGVYLSGYSGHYGIRFDHCGYTEHSDRYPASIGGMTVMEHMMMTGQTVTDGPELIWQQCVRQLGDKKLDDGYTTHRWEFFPQFTNVYLDVWRKFTTDRVLRIMPREEVIDSTRIAIHNDYELKYGWVGRRSFKNLFTGLYALDDGTFQDDSTYLKCTGRYTTIPTMHVGEDEVSGFQRIIKQTKYREAWPTEADKVADFQSMFPPQAEDDPNGGLYVRHIDNNWLVYNTTQFEDKAKDQTSTFSLLYNSCSKVKVTMPYTAFGLVTEKADGLDIYLNNYRTYETTQKTDVITITGCSSKPTYTMTERGSHTASTVSEQYADGSYTLTVTHNGPLDIAVKCTGNNTNRLAVPEAPITYGCDIPEIYRGPRQYEFENADYMNITLNGSSSRHDAIPGFTALGYVTFGNNRTAKLRDNICIDEPGTYKLAVRYLSPDADISGINISVNGSVLSRNTKFPQTDADNNWATTEVEIKLPAGTSELIVSTTKVQSNPFYLDSFTLTPVADSGIDAVAVDPDNEEVDDACYNLQGQRIDPAHRQKGQIYFYKGKKELFR